MPPKKNQKSKMSLNEFLGDSTLGSWADEMDHLPTAPAIRPEGERGDEFGRRGGDFLSSRPDRQYLPQREELPLPTKPPYTAFIGNMAFDLVETDLENFFQPHKLISVKVISDRDGKPKGFGYVEFAELEGLKDALARSGTSLAQRTIRVSVAEPPKDRVGGGFGMDDEKFESNWRRDGPLPPREPERRGSRFDGPPREPLTPSVAETTSDWRSNRASKPLVTVEPPEPRRRPSGFGLGDGSGASAADTEDRWSKGTKFKPASPDGGALGPRRLGSLRGTGDMGPPRDPPSTSLADEGPWRRPAVARTNTGSPPASVPSTPSTRRKLELLPRSNAQSTAASPVASPQSTATTSKSNPFGDAKPTDAAAAKEQEVAERLDKERAEKLKEVEETRRERGAFGHSMSRETSRTGYDRSKGQASTPPATSAAATPSHSRVASVSSANVRPTFSFANAAAAGKLSMGDTQVATTKEQTAQDPDLSVVEEETAKLAI